MKRKSVTLREALNEPFIGLPHGRALQAHLARRKVPEITLTDERELLLETGGGMVNASREGRPFKLRVRLGSFEAICAMVESGVGLAIVPESAVLKHRRESSIRIVPLSNGWAFRRLVICARDFVSLPAHARDLVDYLTDSRADIVG